MRSYAASRRWPRPNETSRARTEDEHHEHDGDHEDEDDDDYDEDDHEELEKDAYHFYKKHAPIAGELVEFLEKRGEEEHAMELKDHLFERYLEFIDIKEEHPEDARRLMALEVSELQAMFLGVKIQDLRTNKDSNEAQSMAKKLQAELTTHLQKLFDQRIEMEERELEHLKAETEEREKRLKTRSDNKKKIIERRIRELTGQADELDW